MKTYAAKELQNTTSLLQPLMSLAKIKILQLIIFWYKILREVNFIKFCETPFNLITE